MSYVVHLLMIEEGESEQRSPSTVKVHVEREYEHQDLENARQAAEVACQAAAKLRPSANEFSGVYGLKGSRKGRCAA